MHTITQANLNAAGVARLFAQELAVLMQRRQLGSGRLEAVRSSFGVFASKAEKRKALRLEMLRVVDDVTRRVKDASKTFAVLSELGSASWQAQVLGGVLMQLRRHELRTSRSKARGSLALRVEKAKFLSKVDLGAGGTRAPAVKKKKPQIPPLEIAEDYDSDELREQEAIA